MSTLGLALTSRTLIPTDTEAGTCSRIAIIIFSVSFRVIVFLAQVRAVTADREWIKVLLARDCWSVSNVLARTYGDWNLRVNSDRTVTTGGCSGNELPSVVKESNQHS